MSEQISTIQTREVLELMRNLAPILNQKELFEFMLFSNRVVERYMPEHYSDELSEEVVEMRKDIEWLKEEVWKQDNVMNKGYIYTDDLMSIINEVDEELNKKIKELDSYNDELIRDNNQLRNELDNQEVLSQEWIDEHKYNHYIGRPFVYVDDLQNLLVSKQDKPVIPKFVADYIEKWKYEGLIMTEWFTFDHDDEDEDKVSKWLYNNDDEINKRREFMLIDAIRYGYEVEKEKLYHVVNKENYFMLRKYDGLVDILHVSPSMSRDEYEKDTRFMLTEKEIKDYDERYWTFAEEVAE